MIDFLIVHQAWVAVAVIVGLAFMMWRGALRSK